MFQVDNRSELSRPVWVEVNLTAISNNVRILQEHNSGRALMAIVKADGYGHGAIAVAQAALEAGATWLGVAIPLEGVRLRKAGITAPILVLGAYYPGTEHIYLEWNLVATLATHEALSSLLTLSKQGVRVPVHLKVDTGMGRLGFLADEAKSVAVEALQAGILIEGIYTHLATADEEDTSLAMQQLSSFRQVITAVKSAGECIKWTHAGNSAALMQLPLTDFNLTRAGIAVYGLPPSSYLADKVELQPAMSLHAQIVSMRRLPAGSSISYGATFITGKKSFIAVLPLGYADGYTRRMSHKAEVLIHGQRFPVVGTICMDQCMVDLGEFVAQIGDEVILFGTQNGTCITADELASWSDTINYEVVCGISDRVPRLYIH